MTVMSKAVLDRPLLLVAPHVQVLVVGAAVGQPWISQG